uniref:Uncharacterized protein n=1 Tax=Lepeophtheirus salmonis TaxID=72036 RepID=A0A0K2UIX2_LEPSM
MNRMDGNYIKHCCCLGYMILFQFKRILEDTVVGQYNCVHLFGYIKNYWTQGKI